MRYIKLLVSLLSIMICLIGCCDSKSEPQPTPIFPEGALHGEYSISPTTKVYFSKGNLFYQASTQTFKFPDKQYYTNGNNNYYSNTICETNPNWVDAFFWGTSGWSGGVRDYRPGTRYNDSSYFIINGDLSQGLIGDFSNADWGVFNAIEGGGNKAGLWRVLSYDEYVYLFSKRQNASSLFAFVRIRIDENTDMNGLFIFPDNFSIPDDIYLRVSSETDEKEFGNNSLSLGQYEKLTNLGCAFLPASGRWDLFHSVDYNLRGAYWTSSTGINYPERAACFTFEGSFEREIGMADYNRNMALSVRLVQEIKK